MLIHYYNIYNSAIFGANLVQFCRQSDNPEMQVERYVGEGYEQASNQDL